MRSSCANCCQNESAHPVAIFTSDKTTGEVLISPVNHEATPVINMIGFPFYTMKICTTFQDFVQPTIFD
jgi:hypothetical protein